MRRIACLLVAACSGGPRHPAVESVDFAAGEDALVAVHSPADVTQLCARTKHHASELSDQALTATSDASLLSAVEHFDRVITIASGTASVLAELHPDASIRDAARACVASLDPLVTDVMTGPLIARLVTLHDPYAQQVVAIARSSGTALSSIPELAKLRAREAVLTGEMGDALSAPVKPLIVDKSRLGGLPADFLASHPVDAQGHVSLDVIEDNDVVRRFASDPTLPLDLVRARRAAVVPGNVDRLRELLTVRHRIAELRGCGSYADCVARTQMVQTTARTTAFSKEMVSMIGDLDRTYRVAVGLTASERIPETSIRSVEAKARDRLGVARPDPWFAYFDVEPTLERLLAEVANAMGLEFVPTTAPTWSPDVRVFDVKRSGVRIGRLYFDLYLRPGKVPGTGQSIPFVPHTPGYSNAPVSVVVSIDQPPGKPSLLMSTGAIRILAHELGHAIDFLFENQSSLVRPADDYFDVPSQLFEVWLESPAMLAAIGRKDGKQLPQEGIDAIRADLRWDDWWRLRFLSAFTSIDLAFHGAQVPTDLSAVYADAYEQVLPIRVDRASHPEASLFIPTIDYAGNGHGLAWGLAICSDIAGEFSRGFQDRATWNRLIAQVFAVDGPPTSRIEKFLGRPWNLDRLRARALPPLGGG